MYRDIIYTSIELFCGPARCSTQSFLTWVWVCSVVMVVGSLSDNFECIDSSSKSISHAVAESPLPLSMDGCSSSELPGSGLVSGSSSAATGL